MTTSLHARIPQEVVENLDRLAQNSGRSRNWMFNEALKQYLDTQQWQIDLIRDRVAESEDDQVQFVMHDKVMRRHEGKLKTKLGI